jgi:hypothetical protein
LNSELAMSDVQGITRLSPDRPVFLIVAKDRSNVVVKQENAPVANDASNLRFANKAMGAVSAGAKGKILSAGEVQALTDYAWFEITIAQITSQTVPPDLDAFSQCLPQGGVWYKMEKADGLLGLDTAVQRALNNGDKSLVRQIATALNAPGGLEMLGKIVAADFFSANTDRFNVAALLKGREGQKNLRVQGGRFDVLQNIGNVLLSVQQGILKPIGLDAYEAASQFRDMDKTVQQLELKASGGEKWPGRRLAANEGAFRKAFAKAVVSDLEAAWGPRNRKIAFATTTRLESDAAKRIAIGMDQGIMEMRNRLSKWKGKADCPAGLADRLGVLGW